MIHAKQILEGREIDENEAYALERTMTMNSFCYYISMKKEVNKVNRIFVDMDGVVADFLGCSDMMGGPLSDDAGHTEYDQEEELTNKRLFLDYCEKMVDYADLIGYIKHTGLGDTHC